MECSLFIYAIASLHFWTDGFPLAFTPPMSFCHLIDKRLDPVEVFFVYSTEVSYPPGILFCWTIGIWPMACLPVVNLEIPPAHKSQSKISTEQSVHSMCPLPAAMPSVCLTKPGSWIWVCKLKNSIPLSLFHIKIESGTYNRIELAAFSTKPKSTDQSHSKFGVQKTERIVKELNQMS